jgi:hypothetical protein
MRARPVRPFPPAKGWTVSNWASDGGLHQRRVLVSVDVDHQVFEEIPDELDRRRDERGAAGVV